jgi:rhamnopyranosyl-N-acetylglucosaminyl-diphospho-decaprenol beta-1,3/1,4-galactofuranosyltransferase
MFNVTAVIVTHNRLSLLEETIASVKCQTLQPDKIIVIDNGSDDGSAEWLDAQSGLLVVHQENVGASGGFHSGINLAAQHNSDWIWVMDDDTICSENALEVLMAKAASIDEPVGFIGSKSLWTDGAPHAMNVPAIKPSFNGNTPFNKYDELNVLLTETTSWVSLILNINAVKEVGLPYKEFFIWSDDCEYTRRITQAGYLGCYCIDSVVVHKTPKNYNPNFYCDTVPNLWKHQHGFRNEFFLKKKYKGFVYYMFWLFAKVGYTSIKLISIRHTDRITFLSVLLRAAWNSLWFNPRIDQVNAIASHRQNLSTLKNDNKLSANNVIKQDNLQNERLD